MSSCHRQEEIKEDLLGGSKEPRPNVWDSFCVLSNANAYYKDTEEKATGIRW